MPDQDSKNSEWPHRIYAIWDKGPLTRAEDRLELLPNTDRLPQARSLPEYYEIGPTYLPLQTIRERLEVLEHELLDFARVCRDEASAHNETALKSAGLEYAADRLHEIAAFPPSKEEETG